MNIRRLWTESSGRKVQRLGTESSGRKVRCLLGPCLYVCVCTSVSVSPCPYVRARTFVSVSLFTHVYVCICMYAHAHSRKSSGKLLAQDLVQTQRQARQAAGASLAQTSRARLAQGQLSRKARTNKPSRTHVGVRACVRVHKHIYIYMYGRTCVRTRMYMYIYIYIYTYKGRTPIHVYSRFPPFPPFPESRFPVF